MSDEKIIEVIAPSLTAGSPEWRRQEARRALHALRDAGYEVVAREPSDRMREVGGMAFTETQPWAPETIAGAVWEAMLSTSTQEGGEG